MAVHYPAPGRHDELFEQMKAMGDSLVGVPGEIRPRQYFHLVKPSGTAQPRD